MSARMPFMPLGSAQPKTPAPGNAPLFISNPTHPLHRGSGQPDATSHAANSLPLAGLFGQRQRTLSHGTSASKNLSGFDIIRSQSTAPGKRDSLGIQLGADQQTVDKDLDRIISPTPLRVSNQKSPLLNSPTDKFKTPGPRFNFNDSFGTSLDHSTGSFGFSNAHIPTDAHQRGPPVHQLPSPDSSDQSGASIDHFKMDSTTSFQTSTPYMHGNETEFLQAQRIFPNNKYGQGNRHAVQQQVEVSINRKRSLEHFAVDNRDQGQSGKRQKVAQQLQDVERSTAASSPVNNAHHSAGFDPSPHQCVLSQVFPGDVEAILRSRMEDFNNRVRYWQDASDEEWEEGLQELKQKFGNMLQKTEDYMKRKRSVMSNLKDCIKQHQELLDGREKALKATREHMLAAGQDLVTG